MEITASQIRKAVRGFPPPMERNWFLVNPRIKVLLDKYWKSLPWYMKLIINVDRILHGVGRYE
jgi:hypothetical protein